MPLCRLMLLAGVGLSVFAQAPCNNTPAFTPCEFAFDLNPQEAAAHPNPYVDVELSAEFPDPDHAVDHALAGRVSGRRRRHPVRLPRGLRREFALLSDFRSVHLAALPARPRLSPAARLGHRIRGGTPLA